MSLAALSALAKAATLFMAARWIAAAAAMAIGRAAVLSREASALAEGPALTGDTHVDEKAGRGVSAKDFGRWIALSVIFVGAAHVALVVHSLFWTIALRRQPTASLRAGVHKAWITALGTATLASFLPGILFVSGVGASALLPPVIVAATGLAFVPLMYWATARRLTAERARLGD